MKSTMRREGALHPHARYSRTLAQASAAAHLRCSRAEVAAPAMPWRVSCQERLLGDPCRPVPPRRGSCLVRREHARPSLVQLVTPNVRWQPWSWRTNDWCCARSPSVTSSSTSSCGTDRRSWRSQALNRARARRLSISYGAGPERWQEHDFGAWTVFDLDTDERLGRVELDPIGPGLAGLSPNAVEVGCVVHPTYWNRGASRPRRRSWPSRTASVGSG